MTKEEKFKILEDFTENRYGDLKTFLHYSKDYELLIAIILSAQAKDEIVNKVTKVLFDGYKTLEDLKNANYDEVYSIIKEVGLGKNKATFIIETAKTLVDEYDSCIPLDRKELTKLKGVGTKVAGVFLGELYNFKFFPVDTHIHRICQRLELCTKKDSIEKVEEILLSLTSDESPIRVHKHLIAFGREICIAGNKKRCELCPLNKICKESNCS